jgi:hypothetical protein
MGSKTTYGEELALDFLLTTEEVTRPTNWYLALHTEDPTDTGAVGELTPGSNGYARQPITFDPAVRPYVNDADIVFGPCVTTNWGELAGWSIKDASTGGNTLYAGLLTNARTIEVTDELKIAAGEISIDEG